jgi:hypothetical protein
LSNEEIEKDRQRAIKLTKAYASLSSNDKEQLKLELNQAPCNIWGYIIELENRVKQLELKLKGVSK